jgi:hypothetical protein
MTMIALAYRAWRPAIRRPIGEPHHAIAAELR